MANWVSAASLYTPRGKRKYLTGDERARFIGAAMAHPRADIGLLCLTLAHLGCRISEALALRPSSISADQGLVSVVSLKKRGRLHVREIPAPDDLLASLSAYSNGLRHEKLWTWSRSQAWRLIKAVMAEAKIAPGVHATPKGLRHAFGLTTAIYADAMGEEEREIASRMWSVNPDTPVETMKIVPGS